MSMTRTPRRSTLLVVAAAATTLGFGAVGAASATGTTEPTDTASIDTEAEGTAPPPVAGSAEPASPEVAAFCEAEVAAEAALASEDPETIGPAFEALVAAAPEEIRATVEELAAGVEAGSDDPALEEAYEAMIEYMAANCGFAELNVAASEYAFGGIPGEVAAGPTIINLENIGEEVHEILIARINDDVTLTVEELLALPEEESESMVTFVAHTFSVPGDTGRTVVEFTPGRHVALCFFPQGTTPEVFEQMMAAEESVPDGSVAAEGSVPTGESAAADGSAPVESSAPAQGTTPAEGSAPVEASIPGDVPAGEGPPHFTLGMLQEFTVV
jgi:hypothetical protein